MVSPRDAAFIGCRLVALYFLFLAVPSLVTLVQGFLERSARSGIVVEASAVYQHVSWSAIHVLVFFLFIALVWFKADWMSRQILPASAEVEAQGLSDPLWNRATVLSLAVRVAGLIVVIIYTPQVIAGIYYSYFADQSLGSRWTPYARYGIPLVSLLFGAALFLGLDSARSIRDRVRALMTVILNLRRW